MNPRSSSVIPTRIQVIKAKICELVCNFRHWEEEEKVDLMRGSSESAGVCEPLMRSGSFLMSVGRIHLIPQKLSKDACLCFHLQAVISGMSFCYEEEELKLSSSKRKTKQTKQSLNSGLQSLQHLPSAEERRNGLLTC